jgi:hypothetical protein
MPGRHSESVPEVIGPSQRYENNRDHRGRKPGRGCSDPVPWPVIADLVGCVQSHDHCQRGVHSRPNRTGCGGQQQQAVLPRIDIQIADCPRDKPGCSSRQDLLK